MPNILSKNKSIIFSFLLLIAFSAKSATIEKSCRDQVIQPCNQNIIVENKTTSTTDFIHDNSPEIFNDSTKAGLQKEWTIITYMAADNDLAIFARKNLMQQSDVGSNERINIVTELNTRIAGNTKVTKRYYVEKNKLTVTNQNDPASQKMDSGSPQSLIDCCKWAIQNYPAKNYALFMWDHGTGCIDIGKQRRFNPSQLFVFNPNNNLIELDRSIPFLDFITASSLFDPKGICFDDSTGHYLTNQDLDMALNTICSRFLGGKKFSIIAFDACLMSMLEIANIIKKYAHYMVGSQEVVLGPGYDYKIILSPLAENTLTPASAAQHIVTSYEKIYSGLTNDFTQSAINLQFIDQLEQNVNEVAGLLLECLKRQKNNTVRDAIKTSSHKLFCTHFDEPSYKDLHHFYSNILANLKQFQLQEQQETLKNSLSNALQRGLECINKAVLANSCGKNLAKAKGISIYFPERHIHNSYHKTQFAANNQWHKFLGFYLSMK